MPTNILRRKSDASRPAASPGGPKANVAGHRIAITAGKVTLVAELIDNETARRIWAALPLYSTAEAWGAALHFETPVESGRERGAKAIVAPGEIAFWSEEDRIVIAYGPTPISKSGEVRLPVPCTIFARTSDDVSPLNRIVPGEKVSVRAA